MDSNNLGSAYYTLAGVRDTEANAQNAINAYQKALKVYTIGQYPWDYANTQNNLGTAYFTLAEVKDTEANAQKAIDAYQEALKIYTVEKYPLDYANTQNNFENAKNLLI